MRNAPHPKSTPPRYPGQDDRRGSRKCVRKTNPDAR
jgi:hypothetical protein